MYSWTWKVWRFVKILTSLEQAYNEQKSDIDVEEDEKEEEKPKRPDLDLDDLCKRINQVAISDDTSSLSTRDRDLSDASQDLTSMAEGDLGDLEDNQPDSSAPEDEQTDHSTQQPIGEYCWSQCENFLGYLLLRCLTL